MHLMTSVGLILLMSKINYAHRHTAYSHESKSNNNNTKWMSTISDDILLSDISIPGTHETMSFYGGDLLQCQSLPLEVQMRAGIRAFDIRCRHVRNNFLIYHEFVNQRTNFSNVLNAMVEFLNQNPTETLLIRVKEEYTPDGNNQTFEETFLGYKMDTKYSEYIWDPIDQSPKLGDVRKKIVVMQNFAADILHGLDYGSFNIQDYYALQSNYDLYNKWTKVKEQIINANTSRNEVPNDSTDAPIDSTDEPIDSTEAPNNVFYMNYLSGSTGSINIGNISLPLVVFPFFVASGHTLPATSAPRLLTGLTTTYHNNTYPDFPRVLCLFKCCQIAFEGTNILAYQFIKITTKFSGIMMIDFPGDGLINAIIDLNNLNHLNIND